MHYDEFNNKIAQIHIACYCSGGHGSCKYLLEG
jgi:hypothetical protein